jgi:1-phosphatidylinositol phosphodiesterase
VSKFETAPIVIHNHTTSELIAVHVQDLNDAGQPMGPGPEAFATPVLMRSASGDRSIPVLGSWRTGQFRLTGEFANGDIYECDYLRPPADATVLGDHELIAVGTTAPRYRVMCHNDPRQTVFDISSIVSGRNWMSVLNGSTTLDALSIPGTHDTCSLWGGDMVQCQTTGLRDQLDAGVRFIDIRCKHENNLFPIYHGIIWQHLYFDTGVLDVCTDFLGTNPNECIIMSIKSEGESNCTRSFADTFTWYVQNSSAQWYSGSSIPTLDQVRGRIVLFRRFGDALGRGIDASPWSDNATFDIDNNAALSVQDNYVVPTVCDMSKKWGHISALLDRSRDRTSPRWYINFTSGSSSGAYPNAVAKGCSPNVGMNDELKTYLRTNTTGIVGSVLMDFQEYPGCSSLVRSIYERNEPAPEHWTGAVTD